MRTGCVVVASIVMALSTAAAHASCPPDGYSPAAIGQLRSAGFVLEDDARRNALAIEVLDCVGSPDPTLRDGLAFEGLSVWLRAKSLSTDTIVQLHSRLLELLDEPADAGGFRRPFAVLILSELARADRVSSVLSDGQRQDLLAAGLSSFSQIRDYRGFSDRDGWRHAVAHGSDLFLQLALNDKVSATDLKQMLDALAMQVAPQDTIAYVHSESERLARAVYFIHRRALVESQDWAIWFDRVAAPAPLAQWGDAFQSESGLAQRHNTLAFLHALGYAARTGGADNDAVLLAEVDKALARVITGGK